METVKDIMSQNPLICHPDTDIESVAKLMALHECGEIPVVDSDDRPIGIITDRDICVRTVAQGKNPIHMKAIEIMSCPVVTVNPGMSLERCCAIMELKVIRRVTVVNDQGKCIGVVSLTDILRHGSDSESYELLREVSRPSEIDYTH